MTYRNITISIVLYLFLIISSASAQFGIKTGPGISDIAFLKEGQTPYVGYEINSLEHRKPMAVFQAGAYGTINISKRIDFQPELLYVMQGLNYSTNYIYDDIKYKLIIQYLQMPLLLKYNLSIRKRKHSGLIAGPYASWKLNAVRITEVEGLRNKTSVTNLKDTDFGVIAGYAFEFKLPSGQMMIELRCGYSLVNMMNRIDGYIPDYYGPSKEYARNVNISLIVGYKFLNIWPGKTESK